MLWIVRKTIRVPRHSLWLMLVVSVCFSNVPLTAQITSNPVPLINNPVVPDAAVPGGPAFTLTINGTGFASGATVNWNGSPRTTTFVSSSQVTANIPASDIASAGTATVTVSNPGGPASPPAMFDIRASVSAVGLTRVLNNLGSCSNLVGDFNGDRKTDLVSCDGSNISVLLGNGDGTFRAAPVSNPSLVRPYRMIAADVNNDGKTDLIGFAQLNPAVDPFDNQLIILLGNGDGTFQPPVLSPVAIQHHDLAFSLAVADFNADGRPDLVITNDEPGGPGAVKIFLGNGDGSFQSPIVYRGSAAGVSQPIGLAVGDFNGDGKLDLAISDSGMVSILFGNGDGSFQAAKTVAAASGGLATADLNGDGKLDLVVAGKSSVSVFLGNGDGTFGTGISSATAANTGIANPLLSDLNGDGKLDLIIGLDLGISILLGNGDGTFQPHIDFPLSFGNPVVAASDFNQDGRVDLAITEGILLQTTVQPAPFGLNFPSQNVGTTSPSQPVFLKNLDTSALAISSVSLVGANPGDFVIGSNSCGASVSSGATCTVGVSFAPTAKGARSASLAFTDGAPASPQTVALTGTGLGTAPPAVALSPTSISFPAQLVSTSSAAMTITLANTGDLPLTINGIVFAGSNAGDFGQTNNCGGGVLGGSSCIINITFTPSAAGARSATLKVIDSASDSPQTIPVSGPGTTDFSISTATSSATVTAGQTATYSLSISPLGGFNQSVALSCSGAPGSATCSVSPSSIQLSGAPATAMVSVTTTAPSHGFALPLIRHSFPKWNRMQTPFLLALFAVVLILCLLLGREQQQQRARPSWALIALICFGLTMTSCGGGSSSSNGGGGSAGTQAGSYTITVTGSFTSGSTTLTHSTKLTLIVQ